ncbi:hypothetical protein E2C01_039192 [Portunus trituberculatus]|uniref:Uncharacterized protein n=1 Tax=Portunus trituberculatus TaxID=210409 RepID=A0A5B7FK21_PORTR|nr:hypothetical protein [Portunus trituberculatus]
MRQSVRDYINDRKPDGHYATPGTPNAGSNAVSVTKLPPVPQPDVFSGKPELYPIGARKKGDLKVEELERSKKTIIRMVQRSCFERERVTLSQKIVMRSPLVKLDMFLDENGLIRGHVSHKCPRQTVRRFDRSWARLKCFVRGQIVFGTKYHSTAIKAVHYKVMRGCSACRDYERVRFMGGARGTTQQLPAEMDPREIWKPYSAIGYLATHTDRQDKFLLRILHDAGTSHTLVRACVVPGVTENVAET